MSDNLNFNIVSREYGTLSGECLLVDPRVCSRITETGLRFVDDSFAAFGHKRFHDAEVTSFQRKVKTLDRVLCGNALTDLLFRWCSLLRAETGEWNTPEFKYF